MTKMRTEEYKSFLADLSGIISIAEKYHMVKVLPQASTKYAMTAGIFQNGRVLGFVSKYRRLTNWRFVTADSYDVDRLSTIEKKIETFLGTKCRKCECHAKHN